MAHGEWLDVEVSDGNLISFDNGSTHYWVSEIEQLIAGFHRTDRTDIRLLTPPPSGPKGRTVFLISRGVSSCQGGPHRRDAVGAFETHLSSRS